MHRKVAAALVAALALALASCGGSEPQLSRAELIRRVEVACRQGQQEAQRKARAAGGGAFAVAISASQHLVMERIDGLNPPDAAKRDFEAMKDAMKQRVELIDKVKDASRADMERVLREIQRQAEVASRKAQEAERRLGIEGCF